MGIWWLLVGAVLSGPLWVAAALWAARRTWRNARRLAARAKGHDHLVELGQLAGGLAHEIKNPLSTINVNLRLLSEDLARHDDDEHRRWLRRLHSVQEESDRLRGILDDFLQYAGKYELATEPADLRRLVSELVDFFGPQADDARVVMRSSLPDQPVVCNVDAKMIKQAFLNLMVNAVQAMSEGGELLIKVSTQRGRAVVEVIDTGPGMPPEQLDRAFEVFYSSKKHGTGMGLPTARRIIREHHGTIRAESEVGKGTRFILALPLHDRSADESPEK